VHQLASEKAYCTAILYLKASEYSNDDKQAFSNLFGAASRAVLQEFASMEEVRLTTIRITHQRQLEMPTDKASETATLFWRRRANDRNRRPSEANHERTQ